MDCYEWILFNNFHKKNNINLINYEKICTNDKNLKELYELLNIKFNNKCDLILKNYLSNKKLKELEIDPELENLSMHIYSRLEKFNF